MDKKNKEIIIQLYTKIDDDGHEETVTEKHLGEYHQKGDLGLVLYTDDQNDIGEIRNVITFRDGKVTVKRSGAVSMKQVFLPGKVTESMYQHPYGRIAMEIKTNDVKVQQVGEAGQQGRIVVDYDMLFQGSNRHYTITIDFMEVNE